MRVGIGYDIHALRKGRPFLLGGVRIPHGSGPAGHSDGDVLWHAIVDALLGALGEGDIGDHFPDTDARWKNASSLQFVQKTKKLLKQRRLRVTHVDSTVLAESPKLTPHKRDIRRRIARALAMPLDAVSVKAKTNEGLGDIGRRKAVACFAIVSLGRA